MSSASTPSFRKFDFFDKSVDGVRDTSLIGALVSVASMAVMVLLFLSELWSFLRVSTVSHMTVNNHHEIREAVVHLHITFPMIPCEALRLEVENIRGGSGLGAEQAHNVQSRMPNREEMRALKSMFTDASKAALLTPAAGCTLQGDVTIARVGGAIRVKAPQAISASGSMVGSLDHYIHDVHFGTQIPGVEPPLRQVSVVAPVDTARVLYTLKAVPTSHTKRGGWKVKSFQYSARSEYESVAAVTSAKDANKGAGVHFAYDFTPVMVELKEEARGFLQFLTSSCAIVGGVFTMSGLLVGFIQHLKRSIKKD